MVHSSSRSETQHESFGTYWKYESLKNFEILDQAIQVHLTQVYLLSSFALIAATVGVYLHIWGNIGGLLTFLGCLGSVVMLLLISDDADADEDIWIRFSLLILSSLLQGATTSSLIAMVIQFDQRILVSAFVGTALAFACFSAAAIVSKRREYLYLGGLLYSGIAIFLWLQFASSIFGGSTAIFKFKLYFGLLIFLGYVVLDTQMIVERAESKNLDFVKHCLELCTDYAAVFVQLLIMMTTKSTDKSEKDKRIN